MKGRVLHVMRMTGVSGAERHLLELTKALRSFGWASDVLIPTPDPASVRQFAVELAEPCDRVTVVPMRSDFSPGLVARLAARLRSGRYAIGHAHLVHADWHLAIAALLAPRVPLVSSKHNHDPFRTLGVFRLIEDLTIRRYAQVIAISDSLGDFTERWTGRPALTVRYGITAPEAPPEGDATASPRLLAVGRLERQKGFEVLLHAMDSIRRDAPATRLEIAGDGGERAKLEELVAELGLGDSVTLLGRREDVPELMRNSFALVHPARWEGFGLVLLEAMREGLPIVATRVGAIPEVVEDGESGILVGPDDPDALAAAVVGLLRDPEHATAIGRAGFRRLKESFSVERMAAETQAVYSSVLSAPRP